MLAEEAHVKVVIADIREDHLREAVQWFANKNLPAHRDSSRHHRPSGICAPPTKPNDSSGGCSYS